MKKFLSLMMMCLLTASMAVAQSVITFDASQDKGSLGSSNPGADQVVKDGVTVAVSNGCMNLTDQYRCYKNATLTITSTVGNITKVEITCTASGTAQYGPGNFTATSGTYTFDGAVGTWTGNAASFVLTAAGAQVRMNKIVVTVGGSGEETVATPTFTPAAGTYYSPINVEIKSGTAGASIYYTTDGTAPTAASTAYSDAIALSQNTTLKAIAIKDGKQSEVAEAAYVFEAATPVANIAAYNVVDDGTMVAFSNPVTAVAQNGNNLYVKDASGYALIYGATGKTYKNGNVIPAGFVGKKTTYNGMPELAAPLSGFEAGTEGTAIETEEIQCEDVSEDLWGHYVVIKGAKLNVVNKTITDNSGTAPIHTGMGGYGNSTDTTQVYDVYAIIGSYRTADATETTFQVLPVKLVKAGTTPTEGITIAEYQALADNTVTDAFNAVTVLASANNRTFVKDETGYMLIYGSTGQSYKKGDVIPAGFTGKKTTYDGEPELATPFTGFTVATQTVTVTPVEAKADYFKHENFGHYVVVKNATIGSDGNITDADGNKLAYYNNLNASLPTDLTVKYDVYGIVGSHGKTNTVYQLLPTEVTLAGGGEVSLPEVDNVEALFNLPKGSNARIKSDIVAIYQNGQNLYVKNGETFTLVYGHLTNKFENGDIICNAVANWTEYQGAKQLVPVDSTFAVAEKGAAVQPVEMPLEEMGQDMVHTYFLVKNASLTDSTVTDETMTVQLFNKFNIELPADMEGNKFDVKCFLTVYNQELELYPVEITKVGGVEYKTGDVNGDGEIDVRDINIIINIMLGADSADNYDGRANVDGEGIIDVADINALVNAMLGK